MKRALRKRNFGNRGFTLSEILVGISFSTILASAAIPATGELLGSYRLLNAANQVSSQIGRARMQAIGQRRFVRVLFQGNGTYALYWSADGNSYVTDGVVMSLPEGVTASVGTTGSPLFNRQGLSAAGSVITLTNSQGQKTVSMNVLGRVSIS